MDIPVRVAKESCSGKNSDVKNRNYECAKSQRNGACLYHAPKTKDIARCEWKDFLTDADRRSALKMLERLIELTKEFKTYRVSPID